MTSSDSNLGTEELNPNLFNNTLKNTCKFFKPMLREGNEFLKPTASQEELTGSNSRTLNPKPLQETLKITRRLLNPYPLNNCKGNSTSRLHDIYQDELNSTRRLLNPFSLNNYKGNSTSRLHNIYQDELNSINIRMCACIPGQCNGERDQQQPHFWQPA